MNIWVKSLLIGLSVAALTFFVSRQPGHSNKPHYTIQYTVEVMPDEKMSNTESENAMMNLPVILKRRCEMAGYSVDIKASTDINGLQINLGNVDDMEHAAHLLTRSSKLEFRELYALSELSNSFSSMSAAAKEFLPASTNSDSNTAFIGSLIYFSVDQGGIVNNGTIGRVLKKDTPLINKILKDPEVFKSFPRDVEFLYGPVEGSAGAKDKQQFFNLYAIKTRMEKAPLKNIDIMSARSDYNFNGQPEVIFQFSNAGARIWERMTLQNKGKYIAIILDKSVVSAPYVNDAISGGSCSISGGFTGEQTKMLASQLNAGFIPVDLSIIEKHISLEKTTISGKNMVMSAVMFLLGGGLSFLIFNSLKRK